MIVVYPDKRYCFDHFRESSTFTDAYCVNKYGVKETAKRVFDFFFSVIDENNPTLFWDGKAVENILPRQSIDRALRHYEEVLVGKQVDDVHYWPFSDNGFLKFLYDCVSAKIIPFSCTHFQPTLQNDQQFMVALKYDPIILDSQHMELENLSQWMTKALPDYYTSRDISKQHQIEEYRERIDKDAEKIEDFLIVDKEKSLKIQETLAHNLELDQKLAELLLSNVEKEQKLTELFLMNETKEQKLTELTDIIDIKDRQLVELVSEITRLGAIEDSTIWRMSSPLRKTLDFLKSVFKQK